MSFETSEQHEKLLTPQEVADSLSCSRNHLHSLGIPVIRLGKLARYRATDVQAFILEATMGGGRDSR